MTTTSKRHQASVKDSDEEEDNIPKQSCVGQPKNISPKDSSDDLNGDVEMFDGEALMPASSVINASEDDDCAVIEEDSHEAALGIFVCLSSAYM